VSKPRILRWPREDWLLALAVTGLAAGGLGRLLGAAELEHLAWAATTAVGIAPAIWWMVDALRHHRLGVDLLALLALVGTLVAREYLAGAVITVMLATGRGLEARAGRRAAAALRGLAQRTPRLAHRYENAQLTSILHATT